MAPALRLGAGPGGGALEDERLRHTTIALQRQCTARIVVQQILQETVAIQSFQKCNGLVINVLSPKQFCTTSLYMSAVVFKCREH